MHLPSGCSPLKAWRYRCSDEAMEPGEATTWRGYKALEGHLGSRQLGREQVSNKPLVQRTIRRTAIGAASRFCVGKVMCKQNKTRIVAEIKRKISKTLAARSQGGHRRGGDGLSVVSGGVASR